MRILSILLFFSVGLLPAACAPSATGTPTLPPVLIQAILTQDAIPTAPALTTLSLPQIIISTPTPGQIPTQSFSSTPELILTRTPLVNIAATATPYALPTQPPLPVEHHINMSGHHQFFEIGCETNAAVDWALYFGVQLAQYDFQYEIPRSDNPDYGFVGSVNDPWGQTPPYSYGVYAGPIAELLNKHGIQAKAIKNGDLNLVKAQLARDNPVIVWVIGNMVSGIPAEYTDKIGRRTVVAAYEHVVILTGYNESTQHIRYLNNSRFFEIPYQNFLNSWKVLGNMAIIRN